jgi:uncharacterized membrane protein
MSTIWVLILALILATAVLRAGGPVLLGGRDLPPRLAGFIALLAPAVLAALLVTATFSDEGELSFDTARTIALGVAAAALLLRAPLLLAVALAGGSAALLRALTG